MTSADLIDVIRRIDPDGTMQVRHCDVTTETCKTIVGVSYDADDHAVNLYCKRDPGDVIGADAPTDRH